MSTYLATEDRTVSPIKLFSDDSLPLEKWKLTTATSTQNNVIIMYTCALGEYEKRIHTKFTILHIRRIPGLKGKCGVLGYLCARIPFCSDLVAMHIHIRLATTFAMGARAEWAWPRSLVYFRALTVCTILREWMIL